MKKASILRAFSLLPALALLATSPARAGSATWLQTPADSDWSNPNNWMPNTVPNSSTDTATFGTSAITALSITSTTDVASLTFQPGASSYSITVLENQALSLHGTNNIVNNSGVTQSFTIAGVLYGFGTSTLDATTPFEILGGTSTRHYGTLWLMGGINLGTAHLDFEGGDGHRVSGGYGVFFSGSTGGSSTIVLHRGVNQGYSGSLTFESGYAGAANITLEGSDNKLTGGASLYFSNAYAATSTVNLQRALVAQAAPATVTFSLFADAQQSTLLNDGGALVFTYAAKGGTARAVLTSGGTLDISGLLSFETEGLTIGSVEGDRTGVISLGSSKLTVGTNNLSATFSGLIQDGGLSGGTGGSLAKVGTRTFTLGGGNLYTGGTTVTLGDFIVSNKTGSATGPGPVQVNGGRIGGAGTIAGPLTIGDASGSAATLIPALGSKKQVVLNVSSAVTFNAGASYSYSLNTSQSTSDRVVANGVTINAGASFSFHAKGNGVLPAGTVFTAIDNTAATPIAGNFSNLAEGATIVAGSNTYQVSYLGGTGNDITLTVL